MGDDLQFMTPLAHMCIVCDMGMSCCADYLVFLGRAMYSYTGATTVMKFFMMDEKRQRNGTMEEHTGIKSRGRGRWDEGFKIKEDRTEACCCSALFL